MHPAIAKKACQALIERAIGYGDPPLEKILIRPVSDDEWAVQIFYQGDPYATGDYVRLSDK